MSRFSSPEKTAPCFFEVHSDVYRKAPDPLTLVIDRARAEGFLEMLDLSLVREVILKREGIARDVARGKRMVLP